MSTANLRETLNHFNRTSRIPETAFAVISRDRSASISSIGRSDGSTVLGKGIFAGSGLFCGGTPLRRFVSDLNPGASPPGGWFPGCVSNAVTFDNTAFNNTMTRDWRWGIDSRWFHKHKLQTWKE